MDAENENEEGASLWKSLGTKSEQQDGSGSSLSVWFCSSWVWLPSAENNIVYNVFQHVRRRVSNQVSHLTIKLSNLYLFFRSVCMMFKAYLSYNQEWIRIKSSINISVYEAERRGPAFPVFFP